VICSRPELTAIYGWQCGSHCDGACAVPTDLQSLGTVPSVETWYCSLFPCFDWLHSPQNHLPHKPTLFGMRKPMCSYNAALLRSCQNLYQESTWSMYQRWLTWKENNLKLHGVNHKVILLCEVSTNLGSFSSWWQPTDVAHPLQSA